MRPGEACRIVAFLLLPFLMAPERARAQSCPGHRDSFATAKIVGGTPAKLKFWPAQAVLRYKDFAQTRTLYFCGGTAIAPNWILTAAHCVASIAKSDAGTFANTRPGPFKDWSVEAVLGSDDLEGVTAANVFQVEDIITHEAYVSPESGNDIALIRLNTPWEGPFARLALSSAREPSDSLLFAAGFGALASGQSPTWKQAKNGDMIAIGSAVLQEVTLPIVPIDRCRSAYQVKPRFITAKIGAAQVCAGYDRGRSDTCQGDSGGPLVFYDQNNCPAQMGVVSWGDGCAAEKAYGVYTRISAHRDWIVQHVPEASEAAGAVAAMPAQASLSDPQITALLAQLVLVLGPAKGRVRLAIAGGNKVKLGGLFAFEASSKIEGRLILIDVSASGEVVQLFPNHFITSAEARFIARDAPLLIPDPHNPAYRGLSGFRATEPPGSGRLIAIVAPKSVAVADIVEAPQRMAKGFVAEAAPASYLSNLFDQMIAAATGPAADPSGWGLGELAYEIVR